ncbi:hypothetical protein [Streptomyces mirabilis]|uniref:hypothetical protein n=1 Tax=Streptomyces mirabilis TaxID=68239 RepID=UPI00339ECE5D
MSSTDRRLGRPTLALTAALVGVGMAGAAPALASTAPVASTSATALVPADFVDAPARALPAAGQSHTFTVSYRNDSSVDQVVAPQILVESPDAGPYLAPADIRVERRNAEVTGRQYLWAARPERCSQIS